jgi:hypothetical protein
MKSPESASSAPNAVARSDTLYHTSPVLNLTEGRKMKLTTLTLSAILLASAGAQAQTIGVQACDDFVAKYETCVGAKVPSAQQPALKNMIDQIKGVWTEVAKDEGSRDELATMCRQTAEQMSASLKPHGCVF